MAITARQQQELTAEEGNAIRAFFRSHPELGEGTDTTPSAQLLHNANAFEDYIKRWNVVVNAESLEQAYTNLRAVDGVLQITSEARMKYAEAAQAGGYTQEHQNILDVFLKRVHLIHDPNDDRTFSNCAALFDAMRGREFNHDNLAWCLQYLQGRGGRGTKLYWEERPRQNPPQTRGHAHIPGERWAPKEESNRSFLPSHSSNPRLNGQLEREQRERDRQRFNLNPDAHIEADIAMVNRYYNSEIEKAVAEGRTHTERARIAQVARQAPGGPRLQAEAAQKEVALIRQDRERVR